MVSIFISVFFLLSAYLTIAYVWLISKYCYGWIKTKMITEKSSGLISVSIIIAARNEEETILNCLNSILQQTYSNKNFEIIVVDDFSTDTTNSKVQGLCENNKSIKLIPAIKAGKKNAITQAIKIASGELIITTDADCVMRKNWLSAIVSFYSHTQANMIVAPICFYDEQNSFEKMQSIEFISLIASTGASLYFNKAIMCNGANLIYTKNVFEEVNGFESIDSIASGDDVLLMYKINEKHPEGIKFLKNEEAIVYTKAKTTLKDFINQRKRWSSKKLSLLNRETKYVALLVFLFNFSCLFLPIATWLYAQYNSESVIFFKLSFLFIGLKYSIDFIFLFLVSSFFNKRKLMIYFIPEQLLYIIYVVFIAIIGAFGKYEWKGRKTR